LAGWAILTVDAYTQPFEKTHRLVTRPVLLREINLLCRLYMEVERQNEPWQIQREYKIATGPFIMQRHTRFISF
jgi:hypothetical protein